MCVSVVNRLWSFVICWYMFHCIYGSYLKYLRTFQNQRGHNKGSVVKRSTPCNVMQLLELHGSELTWMNRDESWRIWKPVPSSWMSSSGIPRETEIFEAVHGEIRLRTTSALHIATYCDTYLFLPSHRHIRSHPIHLVIGSSDLTCIQGPVLPTDSWT